MKKEKNNKVRKIILGTIPVAVLGYYFNISFLLNKNLIGAAYGLIKVMSNPFVWQFDLDTLRFILFFELIYAGFITSYFSKQKNLMLGREYGSAKYMDVKTADKKLADEDCHNNRQLSQNLRVSLNTRKTGLNNNVLIIGGSGSGKTFYMVKPNLLSMPGCSFVCTDPKGEIARSCAGVLKDNGYKVKILNLIEPDKSDRYNPFSYLRSETDVVKLVTNIISNTTPKGAQPSDPFWEKAEGLFLQSLILYVWMEMPTEKRNFATVMELLSEAEVSENKKEKSKLTQRFELLEKKTGKNGEHPAVKQYNKCMRGAGDTVRSIIISANSRLAYLENKQMLNLLSADDMKLEELGIGAEGDEKTKTALFCIIPDSDKSYNFIVGMLYTQVFQELYYQADFNYGGRLPIHVTLMLDEFANVALPDDFCSLLSTMRSREISSVIIIQNLAQIKALFKETWETIPGNCDTLVYLGGNEQSTHKYISELLGKGTIDKRSNSETLSRNGSKSNSYDVIGRELMTADETRKMNNKYELIFIRGLDPIIDEKYKTMQHPMFEKTSDGGGKCYIHVPVRNTKEGMRTELLGQKSYEYYKKRAESGDKRVNLIKLSYKDLLRLTSDEVREHDLISGILERNVVELENPCDNDEAIGKVVLEDDQGEASDDSEASIRAKVHNQKRPEIPVEIAERMKNEALKPDQFAALINALVAGLTKEQILEFLYASVSAEKMNEYIKEHEKR